MPNARLAIGGSCRTYRTRDNPRRIRPPVPNLFFSLAYWDRGVETSNRNRRFRSDAVTGRREANNHDSQCKTEEGNEITSAFCPFHAAPLHTSATQNGTCGADGRPFFSIVRILFVPPNMRKSRGVEQG